VVCIPNSRKESPDGVEEEEATKFVRGQQTQIHSVLVECFGAYESNCKKGKHDLKELQAIILVLRALIVHLQDAIAEGWQTRSLCTREPPPSNVVHADIGPIPLFMQ